jgi:hypothetical protein
VLQLRQDGHRDVLRHAMIERRVPTRHGVDALGSIFHNSFGRKLRTIL